MTTRNLSLEIWQIWSEIYEQDRNCKKWGNNIRKERLLEDKKVKNRSSKDV